MNSALVTSAPIVLLPVLLFLIALRYMDSYRLTGMKTVLLVIAAGALSALGSYLINSLIQALTTLQLAHLTRYVTPVTEELLKGSIIVWLMYKHRIGFLVDAAVFGFAAGTGFALVENIYYLQLDIIDNPGVWIMRGFGTAIMHGGVTAIFAIVSQALTEQSMRINPLLFLPGLATAMILHSVFNHFFLSPVLHTVSVFVFLPPLLYIVFRKSSASLHSWLHLDFDNDVRLLTQINSGEFTNTRMGRFLTELREKFAGPLVVDMLCYLRLHTELALRAKGILMMRERGIKVPPQDDLKPMLEELRYLEQSIGRVGVLTIAPYLHFTRKDLWQLNILPR